MIAGRPPKLKGFRADARAMLPADVTAASCPSHSHQRRRRAVRTAGDLLRRRPATGQVAAARAASGAPVEPVDRPLVVRPGAQAVVETDRRCVPVEHRPLDPAAAALERQAGQLSQQRLPDSAAARLRDDEQVLEVDPRLAEEGREGVEEQREADRHAVVLGQDDLGVRTRPEQRLAEPVLGRHHFVEQALVVGERADEGENLRDVGVGRGAERHANRHAITGSMPLSEPAGSRTGTSEAVTRGIRVSVEAVYSPPTPVRRSSSGSSSTRSASPTRATRPCSW